MCTEQDVFITCHTNELSDSFSGVFKLRFRDFQVNEVDTSDVTAYLQSLDAPCTDTPEQPQLSCTAEDIPKVTEQFKAIAGDDNASRLSQYLTSTTSQQDGEVAGAFEGVVLGPIASKDTRRAVHQFFRSHPHLQHLTTDAVAAPNEAAVASAGASAGAAGAAAAGAAAAEAGADAALQDVYAAGHAEQRIRILPKAAAGQGRAQRKRSREGGQQQGSGGGWGARGEGWPGGTRRYCRFVLFKENMDSQAAVGLLARMLHCRPGTFSFAGTKDKRGVTSQFVTAFKVAAPRLAGLNARLRGVKLGNFEYVDEELRLGALAGNRFKVLLRNVLPHDEDLLARVCEGVRQRGFINYFGLQRFGTGAVGTHLMGAALLRGEFEQGARMILQGRPNEKPEYRAARDKFLQGGDIQGALKGLPQFMVGERAILEGLKKAGATNYTNALLCIPRPLRMMYLHAFQSFIWNAAASHRCRVFGVSQVVEGDLVLLAPTSAAAAAAAAACEPAAGQQEQQDASAPAAADADADAAAMAGELQDETLLVSSTHRLAAVHMVTAEEAARGAYSIDSVVLPLPGCRVQYPGHATAEVYKQVASQHGVDLDAPQHSVKELSLAGLSGDYRRIVHRPKDMTWQLIHYSDPLDDSIVTTDLEDISGPPPSKRGRQQARQQQEQQEGQEQPDAVMQADAGGTEQPQQQQQQQQQQQPQHEEQHAVHMEPPAPAADTGADGAPQQQRSRQQLLALLLTFKLPSSCYATMLLREVTKASTAKSVQKTLAIE